MCVIPISTVVVLQWNGDKFDQDRGRMKRENAKNGKIGRASCRERVCAIV